MQNQFVELASQTMETAFNTAKELAALNAKTAEQMIAHQLDAVTAVVDASLEQMKRVRDVKTPEEFVDAQREFVESSAKQGVEQVRKGVSLATEVRDSYSDLMQKNVAKTVKELKTAKKAA
ncbi:MAG: phasin family protein [Gammaproteobacteria bacterium]|nr:phasin family protein [Gammaproteobacteria bacterium]MDH3466138.1 phasin family protein [Gammaproteobacteria bacterium]